MVIGVQIAKPHPFGAGHSSEIGMRRPGELWTKLRELDDQCFQFANIVIKFRGTRTTPLLINFRERFETSRPRQRRP